MKNYKIANNSTTTEDREKIGKNLKPVESKKVSDVCITNLKKTIKFYLIKITHWFTVTTKLFTSWNIPLQPLLLPQVFSQ